ncbi:TetR/AcrR family transcriptional regulator [Actinomadura sp. 3N407]|uniref:TetR/AcrR family transcriptional regulator n=1 Tax=Actinomadura sp. 3N407 TaxID=3457423 RepID=UPI003FCC2F19
MTTESRRRKREPSTAGGQNTRANIKREAVRLFREKGFESATLRELAATVGIEAASIYNHFPSKHDLLADILITTVQEVLGEVRTAVSAADENDPRAQIRAAITAWVLAHGPRLDEAYLSDVERRSLRPADAEELDTLRRELSGTVRGIVHRGCEQGVFVTEDADVASALVMSTCARLGSWYRRDGRLGLPVVADIVSASVLRMLGA